MVFACLLVAVAAKPQLGSLAFPGFGNAANGFGNSGSTQGLTSGIGGTSGIQQSFANAGVSKYPGA